MLLLTWLRFASTSSSAGQSRRTGKQAYHPSVECNETILGFLTIFVVVGTRLTILCVGHLQRKKHARELYMGWCSKSLGHFTLQEILWVSLFYLYNILVANLSSSLVFVLPWLVIPRIKMARVVKYSVYGVFLLGIFNMLITLLRFLMIQLKWCNDRFLAITFVSKFSLI